MSQGQETTVNAEPDEAAAHPLEPLRAQWMAVWPAASTVFSPYTRLRAPALCLTREDEQREDLHGSFAMIRLRDLAVVVSLRLIQERGLEDFALEILAHEVGHHVHAPGSMREQARLLSRIRRGLTPPLHSHAPLVANLYSDLLLNDRLQRSAGLDMAGVYARLRNPDAGPLWTLYMRIYERLWRLPTGKLGSEEVENEIERDADLGARIIRLFRTDWLRGAVSFAALVRSYIMEEAKNGQAPQVADWMDTVASGDSDEIPGGLTSDEEDDGPLVGGQPAHPSEDPRITGEDTSESADGEDGADGAPGVSRRGGDGSPDTRTVRKTPAEYVDIMKALGVKRDPKEVVAAYYKELATRHLIPFPTREMPRSTDPLPEGVMPWEPGGPMERIDWMQTLVRSPVVIPGVTTMQRTYGETEGGDPERKPPDLYVGVDCSGSMGNPAVRLSYPALAGAVILLSALRVGARAKVCLSGEWKGVGHFTETPDFSRDERKLLGVLTDYLGTGASFGLTRLVQTFVEPGPFKRSTHILVVSDSDWFGEVSGTTDGWELLAEAVRNAGGGATAALRVSPAGYTKQLEQMRQVGMEPYCVSTEQELVTFARAFARMKYGDA